MHPWMAVWVWSVAMQQVARNAIFGIPINLETDAHLPLIAVVDPATIHLGDYLQSEIITQPLPAKLLDQLSELYWNEREPALAI